MVVADPAAELVGLVRAHGDPAPSDASPAEHRAAQLLRRRFGLSLPPPFIGRPNGDEPIRLASATDGAAIAAVKHRAFGTNYRNGILPDTFLDRRGVVPTPGYWTGRAMVPPSNRHLLLVWGRPGTVFGYLDAGPAMVEAAESDEIGEIFELYVDPSAQGGGGGVALLASGMDRLVEAGFGRLELSTLTTNSAAQRFYERQGWEPTGAVSQVDLGAVAFEEARYAWSGAAVGFGR